MRMKIVFGLIGALFIGILILTYIATKLANPVMLDERGRPISAAAAPHGHD
jgi:hypothetical protein